jgi:hypothetical protein
MEIDGMLRKFLPIFLIASVFLSAAVPAQQSSLHISQMEISIWPEYDRPETLVIYRVSFSSITDFPAKVSLRIPSSAGDPYLVAMKDLDGLLYELEYTSIADGAWNRIEFITSSPDLQIEFYDPITHISVANHDYSFRWLSDYPIDSLKVEVQKPKYATTMTITPDIGTGQVNPDDELTYYSADLGNVNQGVVVNIKLSYLKTNNELSASLMTVHAVNPISKNKSLWQMIAGVFQPVFENNSLVIAFSLLFGGIGLFICLSLLTMRFKKRLASGSARKSIPDRKASHVSSNDKEEVYCHQCGKRAKPGDLFCRVCGSKLIQG